MKSRHTALASLTLLLCLTLSGCIWQPDGGPCQGEDSRELARLTLDRSGQPVLISASGLHFDGAELATETEAGGLYWLSIRRHAGASCPAQQLLSAESAAIEGVHFSATPEQRYQAAFLLAEAKSCRHEGNINACSGRPTVVDDFVTSDALIDLLAAGDPRSIDNCSPATLDPLLAQLSGSARDQRLVACMKDPQENELPVLFRFQNIADSPRLLLQGPIGQGGHP